MIKIRFGDNFLKRYVDSITGENLNDKEKYGYCIEEIRLEMCGDRPIATIILTERYIPSNTIQFMKSVKIYSPFTNVSVKSITEGEHSIKAYGGTVYIGLPKGFKYIKGNGYFEFRGGVDD